MYGISFRIFIELICNFRINYLILILASVGRLLSFGIETSKKTMVTLTSLEEDLAVGKPSDCLVMSQSSVPGEHKVNVVREDGNINLGVLRSVSRSVDQSKTRSDMYIDSMGVVGAQNESSLFSSSLSDLFNHNCKLKSYT